MGLTWLCLFSYDLWNVLGLFALIYMHLYFTTLHTHIDPSM